MPPARTCSECGDSLAGHRPGSKTCSNKCRQTRSRRSRRAKREHEEFEQRNPEGAREVAAIVRREAPDVITRVMKDQLAPIVRDAITEDTLRAIQRMLGLTDRAVQLLELDLENEDPTVRQKAYALVMRYTVGHPALVQPADTAAGGQMVVNFNLPRPDDPSPGTEDTPEQIEMKVCDMCQETKTTPEFVAGSDRCTECYESWRTTIIREFT